MENNHVLPSAAQSKSCRELVEQAENLALADLEATLHIPDLCRALGVSDRTLRKAFHEIHGIAPCRHLRMTRLSQARWTLLYADCELVTVTDIATCFGFVELGRFSVEYRKMFGESPSQTLRRAKPAETRTITTDALGACAIIRTLPEAEFKAVELAHLGLLSVTLKQRRDFNGFTRVVCYRAHCAI